MENQILFTPLKLKNGAVIKNRFLKSAMSEGMANSKTNSPNELHVNLYRKWANGGTGLLITGNVMIDRQALGEPGNVVIEDERDMEMLKKWAEAGKENNTHIWMQINHPGKQAPKSVAKESVAPSAIEIQGDLKSGFVKPRELTKDEIKNLIKRFGKAAEIAKKSGFTGVQIHGAHGYLISQFLSSADNVRNDEYGGSIENRMRFLVDIYNEMREKVGKEFPIGLKINSSDFSNNGFTEEESIIVIKKMSEIGVDLIEISGGNYENSKMLSERGDNEKVFFIDYAKKVLSLIDTPIVVTGGFKKVETMQKAIEKEKISMIGIARPIVIYPNLPNEIKEGNISSVSLERLTTGFRGLDKKLGGLIGLSYYEQQIRRLAENKPLKIHRNAWSPLLFTILYHGKNALKPRRR